MGEEKKEEKAISRRKYLGAVGGLAAAAAVGWGLAGYLASKPTAPAAVKTVTETKTITAMPTPAVTPTPVRKLKIGFSPYYVDDDWYRVDVKGAEFYAEDHGNELLILNPHGDPETQIKNVKYMVESGIDALIISPTDPKALTETIDWVAKDKKIPVICTNTDAETASIAITVMSGTVEIGEMIAEAMVNAVKKDGVELEGDVFVASGPYGETQARMLWEGYNNVLGKYSGLKLQRFECPTWGADEAQKAIVDAIKGIGKPLMILGTNMTTTLGCVEGVKRAGFAIPRGKSGHIYVGGFDCSKAGAEYIKEGLLDAVSDVPNPHWEGLGQYFARLVVEKGIDALPPIGVTVIDDITKPDGPQPDGTWNIALERGCKEHMGANPWTNPVWAPAKVVEAFGHRWLRTGGIIVTPENVDTYEGWYVLVDKWLV
jgi:ABC-type sugar transport system substrate-binding protein